MLLRVNWVGLLVVATLSVAAYVAAVAFGERILPFLLFAALPISLFLTRPNRAAAETPDPLEGERTVAPDGAHERGATDRERGRSLALHPATGDRVWPALVPFAVLVATAPRLPRDDRRLGRHGAG